jgi:hypothetical protein
MKKIIVLIFNLILLTNLLNAKHIDIATAKKVGEHFFKTQSEQTQSMVLLPTPVYIQTSAAEHANASVTATPYFYVFNSAASGYVIVSADDNVYPVLGYSDESNFNPENMSPSVQKWLEEYKSQIRYIIDHNIAATPEITSAWDNYLNGTSTAGPQDLTNAVTPMLAVKWNQAPFVNDQCPFDASYNKRTVTGCVATAMAQIMKFWGHPAKGSGFHSYNHSKFGTMSANFGTTTYNWSSMPNYVNSANATVASMMYQLAVSVNMNFGVAEVGGSGAFVISSHSPHRNTAEYAFKTYFGYRPTIQGIARENYTEANWITLLKNEISNGRPVLYAGFGNGGGHAFVFDGFDNNNFFHVNWGWGGSYDGYFRVSALNPIGVGTGGGSGGFNSGHQAIIGIQPQTNAQAPPTLNVNSNVNISTATLNYGSPFSVNANLVNSGTSNFTGDYCAAIFDLDNNFIDYVKILTGYTLNSGFTYNNNLVFSADAMFNLLPGSYRIRIFYKPTGGNWIQAGNNGSFTNLVNLTVVLTRPIELNSTMSISPNGEFTQGQPGSVNLNVINKSGSTFTGQYIVNLYNLDGSFVQTLGTINETNGLPNNFTYQSPFLNFSSSAITANPGTYLVAVLYRQGTSGNFTLMGTGAHQNPRKVIVKAATINADIYEPNNTPSQAHNLSLTFNNNEAKRTTVGANIHIGSDVDHYKLEFAPGYNYTVKARIHDSYNSGDGISYTLDGLISFSKDGGNTWSDAFDHNISPDITFFGGGICIFKIAPYFSGQTGTYKLDITVNRSVNSNVKDINQFADLIRVFPNPTKSSFTLDLNSFEGSLNSAELIDMFGKTVMQIPLIDNSNSHVVLLDNVSSGIYFARLHTSEGILSKKIVITK